MFRPPSTSPRTDTLFPYTSLCRSDGLVSKVLVIGVGGVGSGAVHKMAMNPDIFSDIHLASRTVSKCEAIAESVKARTDVAIGTYAIDADDEIGRANV